MITEVIYCPECGRCYHSASPSVLLGCGHRVGRPDRIRVRTESAGGYEQVTLRRCDNVFTFLVRPNGSVEWRHGIYSGAAWEGKLAARHPLYPAAFRARRDIEIFKRIPEEL